MYNNKWYNELKYINKKPNVEKFADTTFSDDTFIYSIISEDTKTVGVISLNGFTTNQDNGNKSLQTNIPSEVKNNGSTYIVEAIGDRKNPVPVFVDKTGAKIDIIGEGRYITDEYGNDDYIYEFTIPDSVKRIEANSFRDCIISNASPASSIKFTPTSELEFIGMNAFTNCIGKQGKSATQCKPNKENPPGKLIIPKSVKIIEDHAFNLCKIESWLEFETGIQLETINEYAFASSWFYGDLTIPKSVKEIKSYAFNHFTGLSPCSSSTGSYGLGQLGFESDSQLTTIGDNAFNQIPFINKHLYIPPNVTTIGDNAFGSSKFIQNVYYIPGKIDGIDLDNLKNGFNKTQKTFTTFYPY
jgi:hypothetical protein